MKKCILIGIFCCFLYSLAFADDANNLVQNNPFQPYGFSYFVTGNEVEIDIDRDKILESIPTLQSMHVVNPDLTQTGINLNKSLIATSISLNFSAAIISSIYDDKTLDALHFKAYLIIPDDYGNNKKHLAYSFNFTKQLNEKINWDNMSVDRFMKVAPNFQFSSWYDYNVNN